MNACRICSRLRPGKTPAVATVVIMLAVLEGGAVRAVDAGPASRATNLPAATHRAFQPLTQPRPPIIARSSLELQPIDAFIQDRLAPAGLTSPPEADRPALIRRVAYVLTGLPPTVEELDAYLGDPGSTAYERMVERYLASPRYGERWARHWLDVAGYADSNGYFNADSDRPLAYRYRDYVIRALNRDDRFDRFIQAQLAGDELADWRPGEPARPEVIELLEATHFLRNGQDGTGESDGNPDEVRADRYYALDSAVQIIGSSLLGLTVQCARCHDHKFEPFTQQDYYALQAVFSPAFNVDRWIKPNERVTEAHLPGELAAWEAREKRFQAVENQLKADLAAWVVTNRPTGIVLFRDDFAGVPRLTNQWSATAPGDDVPAGQPPVELESAQAPGARIEEGRLQIIEGGGPGDRWLSTRHKFQWRPARTGEWIQVTFDLVATRLNTGSPTAERIGYVIATHDYNDNSAIAGGNLLIDGNPGGPTSVHVDYPGADSRSAGKIGTTPYQAGRNYGIRITRTGADQFALEHLIDGVADGTPLKLDSADLPDGGFGFEYCCGRSFVVDNVLIEASPAENSTWARREAEFQKTLAARRRELEGALQRATADRTPKPGRLAWVTDAGTNPPVVRLLKRGDPKTPGEPVPAGVPVFLQSTGESWKPIAGLRDTTGQRLALARWLTSSNSVPGALLARVTVNRIWQHHFGRGLVSTPENLGRGGSPPSHPELLDWLAAEFIAAGWSQKSLHRMILRSHTFRQSSRVGPSSAARDPHNQWLARYPVWRLDADAIRDGMLAVGGRLGPKTSGPYVPTTRSGVGEVVIDEQRADAGSRSLFLQHRRTQMPTFLSHFGAPAVVFNCPQRRETTMPLQSLSQLNSEFAVNRAAEFADRLQREAGDDESAIRLAFRLTTSREPTRENREAARHFLAGQRQVYQGQPNAVRQVWADFCQMLLAANEFLFLE